MYYTVSNRVLSNGALTSDMETNSYWTSDGTEPLDQLSSWTAETPESFRKARVRTASKFPQILGPEEQEKQRHMGVFVHGTTRRGGTGGLRTGCTRRTIWGYACYSRGHRRYPRWDVFRIG